MSNESPRSYRWRLAALALAMLLPSLGTSIANVALPTISVSLGVSSQDAQWVVIAYLLAVTGLVVVFGRLSDAFGRRRLLLGGIGVFALASIAAMFSDTLWLLVGFRAAQGAGAAAMMALTTAAVGDMVPKERSGSAMGLLATVSAVGTALGPSIGGAVLAALGWHAVFGVMGAGAIVAWLFGYALVPQDRRGAPGFHLDIWGVLILVATLSAYALAATSRIDPLGTSILWVGALLGLGLFIAVETRVAAPLVDLRLLADPVLATSLASLAVVSAILMSTLIVGPFYLSQVLRLPPLGVGLVVSVGPTVTALVGLPAGHLVDRLGAARVTLIGLSTLLLGTAAMMVLPARLGTVGYIASIATTTAGYALFQTAANTAIMARAGSPRRGVVSALLALARNLGLISGASVMGAIFAAGSTGAFGLPIGAQTGLILTFGLAAALTTVTIATNVIVGGWAARESRRG